MNVLSSLGFRGGQGGDSRGGGGYGGESFLHLVTGNNGKGGDISGTSWTVNTNGLGGGGAGDTSGQFLIVINNDVIVNRKFVKKRSDQHDMSVGQRKNLTPGIEPSTELRELMESRLI